MTQRDYGRTSAMVGDATAADIEGPEQSDRRGGVKAGRTDDNDSQAPSVCQREENPPLLW